MSSSSKMVLIDACNSESIGLEKSVYNERKYTNKLRNFSVSRKSFIFGVIDSLRLSYYQMMLDKAHEDVKRYRQNVKIIRKRINANC